jgi:uncharacterized protein
MLFLIRYPEIGKEPRPEKSKARRDLIDSLTSAIERPEITTDTGRIFVGTQRDETDAIAAIHGISSFSPCERCTLGELDAALVRFARPLLDGGRSFAVKVKRVGDHPFTSQQKAAELGALVARSVPGARVDLGAPDETLQIEIRGDDCYLFSQVLPGRDARDPGTRRAPEGAGFVVDHMLGTLAMRMRMLGIDTSYYRDTADSFLLRRATEDGRTLLTQDRELARLGGPQAYLVASKELSAQVAEVVARFGLVLSGDAVFTRCTVCNARLEPIDKETAAPRVPAVVLAQNDAYFRCPDCEKIYWKGTHYDRFLEELLAGGDAAATPEGFLPTTTFERK